jgi:hypothetical protein
MNTTMEGTPAWFADWARRHETEQNRLYQELQEIRTEQNRQHVELQEIRTELTRVGTEQNRQHQEIMHKLNPLTFATNPLNEVSFRDVPVIDAASHRLLTNDKTATWTWIKYGTRDTIIGSAHCALPYQTISVTYKEGAEPIDGFPTFVSLPESVLNLGVKAIEFLQPYEFTNPLPVRQDFVFIHVEHLPPQDLTIPVYQGNVFQGELYDHRVVGRALGSNVSSLDGLLVIDPDADGFKFLLGRGEPGDSGTLLFCVTDPGSRNYGPIGVFRGILPRNSLHTQARGEGTMIPRTGTPLTQLPVCHLVDVPQGGVARCKISQVHLVGANNSYLRANVRAKGRLQGVELFDETEGTKTGVFVNSQQPLFYIGEKDMALMSGKFQPAEDVTQASFL